MAARKYVFMRSVQYKDDEPYGLVNVSTSPTTSTAGRRRSFGSIRHSLSLPTSRRYRSAKRIRQS